MKKKTIAIVAAIAVCAALTVGVISSQAVYSESDEAGKTVSMSDSQIEESTLIIGSYLININGLTDQIYELATDSASNFNQNNMYYKSELAGGKWFDISDATQIADITTEGTPVDTSEIEALGFTHSVSADGTITDLRTGQTVCPFNIPDPYNLSNLPELDPIKLQYQGLQGKESKSDSDETNIDMLAVFFALDTKDDTTNQCDTRVNALYAYEQDTSGKNQPSTWVEQIDNVTASVDATRRLVVYNKLADYLTELLNKINGKTDGTTFADISIDSDYSVNSELVNAIGEAQSNVQTSITSYTAKLITEGTTISSKATYSYSNDMISAVDAGSYTTADTATRNLVNLSNIVQSVVADSSSELDTLNAGLLTDAYNAYRTDLAAGVSSDYSTAVSEGATDGVKNSYLEEQKTSTDTARLEYQTYLSETWSRSDNAAAQSDCLSRIEGVQELRDIIPDDAARNYQLETVEDHLVWLRQELAQLIADSGDASTLSSLKQQKDELDKDRREALDDNDLEKAKELEAQMEAVQQDIDTETSNQTAILNSSTSSDADKSKALAALTDGSTAKVISTIKDEIVSAIRDSDQDADAAINDMSTLTSLASYDKDSAKAALSEIQDALNNASNPDSDLAQELDSMAEDLSNSIDGMSDGYSLEQLKTLLSDYFSDSATAAEKAGALIGLSTYAEDAGDKNARNYAVSLATSLNDEDNSYIYGKYTKATDTYVSLFALKQVKSYRYVYDQAHYTVTLTKGTKYYKFTNGSKDCTTGTDITTQMSKEAGLDKNGRTTLYISGDDCSVIFKGITGYYVPSSDYASIRTPEMESTITEVYNLLMNGGEE